MWACGANIYNGLFRVTNIRFSKCSGVSFGVKTQPCGIRLPWLKPYSRQRPVAVLLTVYRTLRKSNILHSHKPLYIFAPHADFCFEYLLTPGLTGFLRCGFLWDHTEIAIVICRNYQNMHIGRRCVLDMILLANEKGMASVKANIYSFNKQSQAMFLSIGFIQTDDEWYEYKL